MCCMESSFSLRGVMRTAETLGSGFQPECGQHPTDRGGESIALPGGDELLHRLAVGGEARQKDPPVPGAHRDAAAIARELVGEILGIGDAEDLGRGVVPE